MAKRFVVKASRHQPPTFYVWDVQNACTVTRHSFDQKEIQAEADKRNANIKYSTLKESTSGILPGQPQSEGPDGPHGTGQAHEQM